MTRTLLRALVLPFLLAACTAQSPNDDVGGAPPGTTKPNDKPMVNLPGLQGGAMPMFQSGEIHLGTVTAPGTGSFVQAKRWAEDRNSPADYGTGSFHVTVDGVDFASTTALSLYDVESDDAGTEYLILGAFDQDDTAGTARVLYVVVKKSDFAAGADVAFDGVDRYALFAAGSYESERPDTVAVATSGTLHFGAAADLTGAVDATLDGAFAKAEWDDTDPGDRPDGGDREPDGGVAVAPIPAGNYDLVYGAIYGASCDGALAGHEPEFEALGQVALGFADGPVVVSGDASQVTVSGAQLTAGYGSSLVSLAPDSGWGGWIGGVELSSGEAGPLATTRRAAALTLANDGTAITGAGVVLYLTADEASSCQVAYEASLVP